jgi:hypothetical protein
MMSDKQVQDGGQSSANSLSPTTEVETIDGIITAVYEVISGPAGQKRDWERMRSLFAPGARLMPTAAVSPDVESFATQVLDVDGYVARAGKYLEENGFFESETARRVETYGHIAHAWSTYESRHKADEPQPFARGINSIQLMHDGRRWWVVSIFWEAETPGTPIPEQYLKSA